jgi:hypothetical protein
MKDVVLRMTLNLPIFLKVWDILSRRKASGIFFCVSLWHHYKWDCNDVWGSSSRDLMVLLKHPFFRCSSWYFFTLCPSFIKMVVLIETLESNCHTRIILLHLLRSFLASLFLCFFVDSFFLSKAKRMTGEKASYLSFLSWIKIEQNSNVGLMVGEEVYSLIDVMQRVTRQEKLLLETSFLLPFIGILFEPFHLLLRYLLLTFFCNDCFDNPCLKTSLPMVWPTGSYRFKYSMEFFAFVKSTVSWQSSYFVITGDLFFWAKQEL